MNKKNFLVVLLVLFLCNSVSVFSLSECGKNFCIQINMINNNPYDSYAILQYMNSMDIESKAAQLFLMNLEGSILYSSKTEHNNGIAPGGFLLFSYNISDSKKKVSNFNKSVKNYYIKQNKIPPFLAIDHEGGYVNRLRNLGVICPSQKSISNTYSENEAYNLYYEQGKLLKDLNIDMNLAPIVEPETEQNSIFLDDRTFGNSEKSIQYGISCINAYSESNIVSVLKHFPGNSNVDPHVGLPIMNISQSYFDELIYPFEKIISTIKNQNNYAVLLSHAMFPSLYENKPACFTKEIVNDILKQKIGFSGLIISDDIYMAALIDNGYQPENSAELAILSGVDIIMISTKRLNQIVDYLVKESEDNKVLEARINESCRKILNAKINMNIINIVKEKNIYSTVFEKLGYPNFNLYKIEYN